MKRHRSGQSQSVKTCRQTNPGLWPRLWMVAGTGTVLLCLFLMWGRETPGIAPAGQSAGREGAGHLTGKVVAISDGDTLTLVDSTQKTWRIRLADIDAPEKGQPFGEKSRQSLAELVFGQQVRADCPARDGYGRQLCTIWRGGQDVNREQVARGMAWVFRRYTNRPDYCQSEEIARRGQHGLWKDARPVPPWTWRKTKNQGNGQ